MLNTWPINTRPLMDSTALVTTGPTTAPDGPIIAWPFTVSAPINSSAIQERLQYLTEIQTSRSGREFRLARRTTPRKRLSFAAVLSEGELPLWQGFIHDSLVHNLVVPQQADTTTLPDEMPQGTNALYLDDPPGWLLPGMVVVLGEGVRREALVVGAVFGNLTYFEHPTQHAWPAGTPLYAGLVGVLDQAHQAELIAPDVASATVDFRVRPLTEAEPEPPPPEVMFDGREVLLARPTWSGPLSQAFSRDVDELDYGTGPIARYSAVPFAHDVIQARYVQAHAEAVLDTYHRARGRQGEFFAPTWMPDLRLRGDVSGSSLRVRGPEVAERYSGSLTHRAVFVHLRDGQTLMREVSGLSLVNDSQGQDTVMTLTEPLTVTESEVVMAGWLLLRRFASDELVIEHYPTGAMSLQAGLMSLELLPEEAV